MEKIKVENFSQKIKKERDLDFKKQLELVLKICELVKKEGGQVFVVGGYSRDEVMKSLGYEIFETKDLDLEVFKVGFKKLFSLLETLGKPNLVGVSFGVIKLNQIDISLPRKDFKKGQGHQDFEVTVDPLMSLKEASQRRDLTINTLMLSPLTGEIISYFEGISDIKKRILRLVDEKRFGEDPLRVLRLAQHVSRFDFSIDGKTLEIAKEIDLSNLSKERIQEEWLKLLLKSKSPSKGLEAAKNLKVISKLNPQLEKIIEKRLWENLKKDLDKMAKKIGEGKLDRERKLVLMLVTLILKMELEDAKTFLNSIKISTKIQTRILKIFKEKDLLKTGFDFNESAIKHLALRLSPSTIEELVLLLGIEEEGKKEEIERLLKRARGLSLGKKAPVPLILGKDLILEGEKEGTHLGEILYVLFKAQLDGKFKTKEEGVEYYKKNLKNNI